MRNPVRAGGRRRLIALVLAATASAHAQPAPTGDADPAAQARKLYEQGTLHYDLREYEAAIAAYREAYRLAPRANVRLDLGRVFTWDVAGREPRRQQVPDEDIWHPQQKQPK